MRFLLYKEAIREVLSPRKQIGSSKLRNKVERRHRPAIEASVGGINPSTIGVSSNDRATSTQPSLLQSKNPGYHVDSEKKFAWGQQCSTSCGCVVRFEARLSADGKETIEDVSYHAKQLVTTLSSTSSSDRPQLMVQLTRQGRPMMQECKCQSLHQLAQATVQNMMKQGTMANVKSTLEFQRTRSSPAFCRSVLKVQGLPETDSHCLDVVEEAVTALCKGHLPSPRRMAVESAVTAYGRIRSRQPTEATAALPTRNQLQQMIDHQNTYFTRDSMDTEDDDHYHFLKFGHSWRDADPIRSNTAVSNNAGDGATFTSSMGTMGGESWLAALLDTLEYLQSYGNDTEFKQTNNPAEAAPSPIQSLIDEEEARQKGNGLVITEPWGATVDDWVSYVDQKYERLEQKGA